MRSEKVLGKITSAHFGLDHHMLGLRLKFQFDGCGVDVEKTVNVNDEYQWEVSARAEALETMNMHIVKLLKDAKVDDVSQLKGKPVEITLKDNIVVYYRILTEVL